jgi:hypothetical protein
MNNACDFQELGCIIFWSCLCVCVLYVNVLSAEVDFESEDACGTSFWFRIFFIYVLIILPNYTTI